MRTIDSSELMSAVETARLELHSELDPDFLRAVVKAEEENPEDDSAAMRAIHHALAVAIERSKVD
jgi:hypothetical protein